VNEDDVTKEKDAEATVEEDEANGEEQDLE